MSKFFLAIYDYLSRHKILAAAILVVCVGLSVWLSLLLHYEENITDFLPKSKENAKYTSVYESIGDQGRITLIFRADTSLADSEDKKYSLMDAVDAFEENWYKYAPDSVDVDLQCHTDESAVFDALDFLRDNVAIFLTDDDYDRIDSLLSIDGYVDTCMQNVKRMLSFPMSSVAVEAITADPLNLFSPVLQRLSVLDVSGKYLVADGYLFDDEGNAFAFMSSPYASSDTKANAALSEAIDSAISATMAQVRDVRVSAVGAPIIAVTNASQIKRDSIFSISIAIFLIMAILLFAMGHWRNILWLGFTIVAGWLFALAVIAIFKPAISIIVIGIGSVLVGIAVNYPLHFLDHIRDHTDRRSALKDMIDPLVTGNITTVSAFACLVFVRAEAMRDLGLFGALMLVGTILFVMVFLPLFAKPGRRRKVTVAQEQPVEKNTNGRWRKISAYALIPVLLITILLGYYSTNTEFDSDLHNINYMTDQQKEDLKLLSGSLGDEAKESLLYVVTEGKTVDEAVSAGEKLLGDTVVMAGRYLNGGVAGLLPSIERQGKSLERWKQFREAHSELSAELEKSAAKNGFVAGAFGSFVKHLYAEYSTMPIAEMDVLVNLCSSYMVKTDSTVNIVNIAHIPNAIADSVKHDFREKYPQDGNVFAFDSKDVGSNLVSALSDDFNYILYVCSFVVFFFLWLSFGRLELALLSFLPLTVGWLWILGLMDIAAVKFNIINIILATFIFGQGDDYTIFITEGLMYEYAYGRKRLRSYQRSVVISAALMFVGIGVLIFAKHPAMRSLAEVAIIGMASVILMACYLPPMIFRWITYKHGKIRQVPVTLKRLFYTFISLLVFFVSAFVLVTPYTLIYRLIGRNSEKKRLHYHDIIRRFNSFAIHYLPGVKYTIENPQNETFDKPAVIIANHQSHLDLVCLLMLSRKIVVLTNDWVWKDPFYGLIIRYAEFYPVSNGFDENLPKLKNLVERGYSIVVFPEGTRTPDGKIGRFRNGAFLLAQQLGIDILPLFIHGAYEVMPKDDIVLREGAITLEICPRIGVDKFAGKEARAVASEMRAYYQQHFAEMCARIEDEQFYVPLVKYQYMYKGRDIEMRCRRALRQWQADKSYNAVGQGEIPLLLALSHKDKEFYYEFENEDDYLVAQNCTALPSNLHYSLKGESR